MSIDKFAITEDGREKAAEALARIEQLYELKGATDVRRALEQSPFLSPLLSEAHKQIRRHFPDAEIYAQTLEDPDGLDQSQLPLYIVTDLEPKQARSKLKAFDAEWWLNALPQAHGRLCISLEFR